MDETFTPLALRSRWETLMLDFGRFAKTMGKHACMLQGNPIWGHCTDHQNDRNNDDDILDAAAAALEPFGWCLHGKVAPCIFFS